MLFTLAFGLPACPCSLLNSLCCSYYQPGFKCTLAQAHCCCLSDKRHNFALLDFLSTTGPSGCISRVPFANVPCLQSHMIMYICPWSRRCSEKKQQQASFLACPFPCLSHTSPCQGGRGSATTQRSLLHNSSKLPFPTTFHVHRIQPAQASLSQRTPVMVVICSLLLLGPSGILPLYLLIYHLRIPQPVCLSKLPMSLIQPQSWIFFSALACFSSRVMLSSHSREAVSDHAWPHGAPSPAIHL